MPQSYDAPLNQEKKTNYKTKWELNYKFKCLKTILCGINLEIWIF